MIKIAIATVNFNGLDDTLELLASLKELDTKGLQIVTVVVDNGSRDNQADAISQAYPQAILVRNPTNTGSAGGFNSGIQAGLQAGADFVLLLNNDCLISDPKLLQMLLKTINSDKEIGAVSPKIYFAPGFEFYKDRYKREDLGKVIWYGGGTFDWNNVLSKHEGIDEVDHGKYESVHDAEFLNCACILMRKEIFAKGIFFDESLFAYFDDNDFNIKLVRAGFRKVYNGATNIYHKVSRTAGIGSPTADYYLTRNRLIFGMRYASLRTKFALLREAFRLLITGRVAQKQGVIDFLKLKRGRLTPKRPD